MKLIENVFQRVTFIKLCYYVFLWTFFIIFYCQTSKHWQDIRLIYNRYFVDFSVCDRKKTDHFVLWYPKSCIRVLRVFTVRILNPSWYDNFILRNLSETTFVLNDFFLSEFFTKKSQTLSCIIFSEKILNRVFLSIFFFGAAGFAEFNRW